MPTQLQDLSMPMRKALGWLVPKLCVCVWVNPKYIGDIVFFPSWWPVSYQSSFCLTRQNGHVIWKTDTHHTMEDTEDAHPSLTWTHNTLAIWSWSMSSMNISHFLLCPIPFWGKNYLFTAMSLWGYIYSLNMSNRTRQAFLYSCNAPRAWTGKRYSVLHSCSTRTQQSQSRDITSTFRRVFWKFESSPTNQVNA